MVDKERDEGIRVEITLLRACFRPVTFVFEGEAGLSGARHEYFNNIYLPSRAITIFPTYENLRGPRRPREEFSENIGGLVPAPCGHWPDHGRPHLLVARV